MREIETREGDWYRLTMDCDGFSNSSLLPFLCHNGGAVLSHVSTILSNLETEAHGTTLTVTKLKGWSARYKGDEFPTVAKTKEQAIEDLHNLDLV